MKAIEAVIESAGNCPSSNAPFSGQTIRYMALLLALVNLFNYLDRTLLSILLPAIKVDLLLSDTQLGLLTGFAFAMSYAVFGIPISRWADRGNRRNIVALSLALWSVMTTLSGAALSFLQLLLTRIGVGMGEAGCVPPAQSIISDYVPAHKRAGILSLHYAGAGVGSLLALALGGWLSTEIGWRYTFMVFGFPGLFLAVLVRFTLREPPRGYSDGHSREGHVLPVKTVLHYLKGCRTYVHLVIVMVFNAFANLGIHAWLPSFFKRSYQLPITDIGFYLGLTMLGSIAGLLLGGTITDRLAQRDLRFPLWFGACSYAVAVPFGIAIFVTTSVYWAFLFVFIFNLLIILPGGAVAALVLGVVLPRMRAMAVAIMAFFAAAIGYGGGPFFIGALSDVLVLTFGDESLRYAMLIFVFFLLFPLIHFLFAAKSVRDDMRTAVHHHEVTPVST